MICFMIVNCEIEIGNEMWMIKVVMELKYAKCNELNKLCMVMELWFNVVDYDANW